MNFDTRFPFSSVYKISKHGLSLYTQEYMQKFLDEEVDKKDDKDLKKEKDVDDEKESKEKFAKKSTINLEPKDEVGEY